MGDSGRLSQTPCITVLLLSTAILVAAARKDVSCKGIRSLLLGLNINSYPAVSMGDGHLVQYLKEMTMSAACTALARVLEASAANLEPDPLHSDELVGDIRQEHLLCRFSWLQKSLQSLCGLPL